MPDQNGGGTELGQIDEERLQDVQRVRWARLNVRLMYESTSLYETIRTRYMITYERNPEAFQTSTVFVKNSGR